MADDQVTKDELLGTLQKFRQRGDTHWVKIDHYATMDSAGLIRPDGVTIKVDEEGMATVTGNARVSNASLEEAGIVRPDGTTITVDSDGTIHGANTYVLPPATTTRLGGVRPDGTTITVDPDGTIHSSDMTPIPTKTSELENDSGFLTEETDPTVPSWAKRPAKPSYTAVEVGALPDTTPIPAKTSELENDSGFQTSAIERVRVNGVLQSVSNKTVSITVSGSGGSSDLATCETGSTVHIGSDFAKLVIRSNDEQSAIEAVRNMWNGEDVRKAVANAAAGIRGSGVSGTHGPWIQVYSSYIHGKRLFSGPFEANTQYTVVLAFENYSSNRYPPLRIKYTDGTYSYIQGVAAVHDTPYVFRQVSTSGKTIYGLFGYSDSTYVKFFYDRCGVFKGDVPLSEFTTSSGLGVSALPLSSGFSVGAHVPSDHMYVGAWDELTIYPNGHVTFLEGTEKSGDVYSESETKTLYDMGFVDMRSTWGDGTAAFDADVEEIANAEFEVWSWSDGIMRGALDDVAAYARETAKDVVATKADRSAFEALESKVVTDVSVSSYSSSYPRISSNRLTLTIDTDAQDVRENGYVGVLGSRAKVRGINTAAFKPLSYFASATEFAELQAAVESLRASAGRMSRRIRELEGIHGITHAIEVDGLEWQLAMVEEDGVRTIVYEITDGEYTGTGVPVDLDGETWSLELAEVDGVPTVAIVIED